MEVFKGNFSLSGRQAIAILFSSLDYKIAEYKRHFRKKFRPLVSQMKHICKCLVHPKLKIKKDRKKNANYCARCCSR